MKIYFACSISGGRQDEGVYQKMVQVLLSMGMDVPSAHISETGIEQIDGLEEASDIYQRDVNWIEESDLLIAEVSTPSHGVGYEIAYALNLSKPVFCLYNQGEVVSKMITGNSHSLLTVSSYQDWPDAENKLKEYISMMDS
jgi:nucleoside 2-deoxyribosyltransferase